MIRNEPDALILAFRPFTRGFAYVLMEGPLSPVDWGIKEIRGGKWNARVFAAVRKLMERATAGVLVIPDKDGKPSPSQKVKRLLLRVTNHAAAESIEVHRYSRADLRACFAHLGAATGYEIAQAIASQMPAFAHRLPRLRRIWDHVDTRLYLFDAAALAMTYYASNTPDDYEE